MNHLPFTAAILSAALAQSAVLSLAFQLFILLLSPSQMRGRIGAC